MCLIKNIFIILFLFFGASGYATSFKEMRIFYGTEKVAKQGDVVAQFNLGLMYYQGKGVETDYKQALYWFQRSAKQGNVMAQFKLGEMYYYGKGVEKNYKQASYWLQKSALKQDTCRSLWSK